MRIKKLIFIILFNIYFFPTLKSQSITSDWYKIPRSNTSNSFKILSNIADSILIDPRGEQSYFTNVTPKNDYDSLILHTIQARIYWGKKDLEKFYTAAQKVLMDKRLNQIPPRSSARLKMYLSSLLAGYASIKGDDITSYFYIKRVININNQYFNNERYQSFALSQETIIGAEIGGIPDKNNFVNDLILQQNKSFSEKIRLMRYFLSLDMHPEAEKTLTTFSKEETNYLDYHYFQGLLYFQQGQFNAAQKTLLQGLSLSSQRSNEQNYYLSKLNLLIGKCFYHLNNPNQAIKYLDIAHKKFSLAPNKKYEKELNLYLSKSYSAINDLKKSNEYLNKSIHLLEDYTQSYAKSGILGIDNSFIVEELRESEYNNKLELNKAHYNNQIMIFWLLLGSFILAGLSYIYYRRLKYNQELIKMNDQLSTSNDLLKESNASLDKVNEKLKLSNQSLKNFANIAAHDLKAPLRTIGAFNQIILEKYFNKISKPDQELFQIINKDTQSLRQLIDDLLIFAKIDQNIPPAHDVDLNEIIQNVIRKLEIDIKEKSAKIQVQNLPKVKGHSTLFLQLFLNTINNSLKFSQKDKPPIINIQSKPIANDMIQISIQDNGIGINKNYIKDIFNPFVKLHSKASFEGSGIGLATCKKVIEFYNGKIWAESEVGKGTSIFFNIPISTD